MEYYVYLIFRPNGHPCYVGKGKGKRYLHGIGNRKNPHLCAIMKKAGEPLPAVILREHLSEDEAFETERAFIAAIGREKNGGPLVNCTDGGEGSSGLRPNAETRAKMRASHQGQKRSDEARANMRAAQQLRLSTAPPMSAELRAKIGAFHKGLKHTPEAKAKMSASRTGKKASEKTRAKLRAAQARRGPASDETRARMRAAKSNVSSETRAKMSAAQLSRGAVSDETKAKIKAAWGRRKIREAEERQRYIAIRQADVAPNCPDIHVVVPAVVTSG